MIAITIKGGKVRQAFWSVCLLSTAHTHWVFENHANKVYWRQVWASPHESGILRGVFYLGSAMGKPRLRVGHPDSVAAEPYSRRTSLFLTAIACLIGLSFLSSILVLAAVIRSGQVDQMEADSRRAALRSGEAVMTEPGLADAHLLPEPDWTPAERVASSSFSLHDRA